MKILAPISSYHDPAARFRLLQYDRSLQEFGDQITHVVPRPLKESDPSIFLLRNRWLWKQWQLRSRKKIINTIEHALVWQNRLLLYEDCSIEMQYTRPFIFDIDDSIWLTEGREQVIKVISRADLVFAGNSFIAEFCQQHNKRTILIPTVVDTQKYYPLNRDKDLFTIGWIGTKSNFQYLDDILPVLKEFVGNHECRFMLVSSEAPASINFDGHKFQFRKWTEDSENGTLNLFDVGIMPLKDDEWTRGKCGLKLLQYMACGKPFIASPVGVNTELLRSGAGWSAESPSEWMEALIECYQDKGQLKEKGEKGRRFVGEHYSISNWAPIVHEEFEKTITKG